MFNIKQKFYCLVILIQFYWWLYFTWRPYCKRLLKIEPDEALCAIRRERGRARFHYPESELKDSFIKSFDLMEKVIKLKRDFYAEQ